MYLSLSVHSCLPPPRGSLPTYVYIWLEPFHGNKDGIDGHDGCWNGSNCLGRDLGDDLRHDDSS